MVETKVEREIINACADWKAPFEVLEIRGLEPTQRNRQETYLKMQRLVKRGLLIYGKCNNTFKAAKTPAAGRDGE